VEGNIDTAGENVRDGEILLDKGVQQHMSSKKKIGIIAVIGIICLAIILIPLLVHFL
jgi:t-SNARE complex subunit (syntaxin)